MGYSPEHELKINNEIIAGLKDIQTIFDVGCQSDLNYLEVYPKAEFHLFEPHPEFFNKLKEKVGKRKNIYCNNYGLGDVEGIVGYCDGLRTFTDGAQGNFQGGDSYPVKTLDWYVKENKIKKIDFLKIDTEGYEYKVLEGARNSWPIIKYIYYEHWNNRELFQKLLKGQFEDEYCGYRNVLCFNLKLVSKEERERIKNFIKKNKYSDLQ